MKPRPKEDFYMVPNKFIKNYTRSLSGTEFKVFMVLLYLSNRFATKFYFTDQAIYENFDISSALMHRDRRKLAAFRLIRYWSGFNVGKFSRATRYKMFPSKAIRKLFRIRGDQNGKLSTS